MLFLGRALGVLGVLLFALTASAQTAEPSAEYPDIVARAAREGHEIGNHTWSHPNLAKMSDENIRRQLRQTDDAIKQATGKHPTLMRPPYGNLSTRQKQWIHQEFGYRIVLWDVDPLDWKRPGPNVICNRIVKETRPGSIVLSHDIHPGTIAAMHDTLDQLEAKGFKFVTVSELIAMAKPETPAPSTARICSFAAKSKLCWATCSNSRPNCAGLVLSSTVYTGYSPTFANLSYSLS